MGIERDYILRQIRLLFELIEKIIRSRQKGNRDEAIQLIQVFYKQLKVEQNLQEMALNDLLPYLTKERNLAVEQIELLAIVLKEEGECAPEDSQRQDYFQKAWFLLEHVEKESLTFSMYRQMNIAELKQHLN